MRLVDTNVLIYSISFETFPGQASRAQEVLAGTDLAVSVQVLQEFYVQATRPTRPDRLSHRQALDYIADLRKFPVQENTLELFHAALATCHRYQISYWDAAIVEAARALGCDTILTEDLQDGQDFGGLRVVNPFRSLT